MTGIFRSGKYFKFVIYLLVVILVNAAGITLFYRLDLTAEKIYSISTASKEVVSALSEPLTINVFFTKDLPAPHNNTERYIKDLLEEYSIFANKYFNYRFYNVSADEGDTTEAALENQKLANNYGINPIQIQAIEKDEVKFQRAYMGLVMIHGDLIEQIPTITTVDGLEYKITTAIQKMNNKIGTLLSLPDKIRVSLFLSSSLEAVAPFMGVRNLPQIPKEVEAIVQKLNRSNYGKLQYEFINPEAGRNLDTIIKEYNILALSWPELQNGNIPPGKGAIGLVMEYAERAVTIPLMQVLKLPLIGTQYKLTEPADLEKLINDNVESLIDINENIAYLADHGTLGISRQPAQNIPGQPPRETLNNFRDLASQNYSLQPINLKEETLAKGPKCLVIAQPKAPFSEYELFQIDQYLMQGNNLALFLDVFNEVRPPGQQGAMMNQPPVYVPLNTGLEKLLEHYGVRLKQSIVMDKSSFRQQMPAQFGGGERDIYFAPLIKSKNINSDLPYMKNIKALITLKVSPLELVTERIKENDISAYRLLASSENSWLMKDRINLNPLFIRPPSGEEEMQSYPLAYVLEGKFPSYFAGKPLPVKIVEEEASETEATATDTQKENESGPDLSQIERTGQFTPVGQPGRIFIMASADMLKDNILDANGRGPNTVFVMNVLDHLNDRDDIAEMRSKEQRFNPLDDTSGATKTFVKMFNIVGLPILVVLFGLIVWFQRASRKRRIQMMFQK